MGHRASVVQGVRSENYFQPGNAINEIWLGDVEIISRLPFGDSDMAQAGWPEGDWPKIPWHPFVIPLERRLVEREKLDTGLRLCDGRLCACRQWGGPFTDLSPGALMGLWLFFLFAIYCTIFVPSALNRVHRYCALSTSVDLRIRVSMLRNWFGVGFVTLIVNLTVTVLGCFALPALFFCGRFPRHVVVDSHLHYYPYMFMLSGLWAVGISNGPVRLLWELGQIFKTYINLRREKPRTIEDPPVPAATPRSSGCSHRQHTTSRPESDHEQETSHPHRQGLSLDSQRTTPGVTREPQPAHARQDLKSSASDLEAQRGGTGDPRANLPSEFQQRNQSGPVTVKRQKSQLEPDDIELEALSKWMSS